MSFFNSHIASFDLTRMCSKRTREEQFKTEVKFVQGRLPTNFFLSTLINNDAFNMQQNIFQLVHNTKKKFIKIKSDKKYKVTACTKYFNTW